ncbi:MAG: hypothetical protein ACKVU4_08125 [Phycisphaerales bacterium]
MSDQDTGRRPIPPGRRPVPAGVEPAFGDRPVWRERIGTYLLGVAIGLVLVGTLLWGRYQAAQRQQQAPAGAPTSQP